MDVNIAEAGKDQRIAKLKVALARLRSHMRNQPSRCVDLDCAIEHTIMVRNPTLKTQHGSPHALR
jgi:hypothetical protein